MDSKARGYSTDKKAFLFSIDHEVKMKIKAIEQEYAILTSKNYISYWGSGDLCIVNHCNKYDNSYTDLPMSYEDPRI